MTIYTPYTYLIGWSKLDRWYYGVRWARGCHPGELWKKYKTSSKVVKAYTKIHGDPDIIQVRKTFTNSNDAVEWEEKVLTRLNVSNNTKWLNKTSQSFRMLLKYKETDLTGMVTITNRISGHSYKITTMEYYLGLVPEGYSHQWKDTPVMMDDKGIKRRIHKDDPSITHMTGHTKGKTHAINTVTGEKEYVNSNDPRFVTGELSGNQKGKRYYTDGKKNYMLFPNDPKTSTLQKGLFDPRKTKRHWFNDGISNFHIYPEDASSLMQSGRIVLDHKGKSRCKVEGLVFGSLKEAANHYGLTTSQVQGRLRSTKYPSWVRL